jgi:hypothetical protein
MCFNEHVGFKLRKDFSAKVCHRLNDGDDGSDDEEPHDGAHDQPLDQGLPDLALVPVSQEDVAGEKTCCPML